MIKRVLKSLLLIISVIYFSGCHSDTDNEESAKMVASNWTTSHIDDVSGKLASVVSQDYATVGSFIIKTAISKAITWSYEASSKGDEQWLVDAHANLEFKLPFTEKKVEMSGNIPLSVNTKTQEVDDAGFDPSSFEYQVTDIQ